MIQSNYELANILGMVFSKYANQVLNGATQPYEALMTQDSVDVVFTVTSEGGFSVKPVVQEKPKVLESLPEAEVPTEHISQEELMETIKGNPILLEAIEVPVEEKPKRSRKKKPVEEVVPTE